jgi:UDP-glucose 4-epimerase
MTLPTRTILITGSSGAIGTNLALRLQAEGYNVIGLDCRANPWTALFPTLICDITGAASIHLLAESQGLGDEIDMIVHLAAQPKVHRSVEQPENACDNIVMAHAALEYCRLRNVPLLFTSSREVYGNAPIERFDEIRSDFHHAASPYAAGKIAVEAMIYSYIRCYRLGCAVVRLSNVYGRYDSDLQRMERVVPLFIDRIARGVPVTVYGARKILDFTYIDDCVEGITCTMRWLLEEPGRGCTLNLASGRGHTLVELAQFIGEALGEEPRIELAPARTGEVRRYVANIRSAQALVGYLPKTSLQEGIGRAVEWWKESKGSSIEASGVGSLPVA